MKTSSSFSKNQQYIYILVFFMMSGCVIPIPEQNFYTNPTNVEYDIYDQTAQNINTYRKQFSQQNRDFLTTLTQSAKEKPEHQEWLDKATQMLEKGNDLTESTESIWEKIVSATGGLDEQGFPLGADQKIVANKILIGNQQAEALQNKINETQMAWLELIPKEDAQKISKRFPDVFAQKDWVEKNTADLRVGILQLSFAHLLFEIEQTENKLLNYCWEKIGNPKVVTENFQIISNPRSNYITKGGKFETDLFLAPITEPLEAEDMQVTINGRVVYPKNGVVKHIETASSNGARTYNVRFSFKNPVTGEITQLDKFFDYQVGTHSINVSATKMNVFYIGVDNPISISVPGVSHNDLKVSIGGGGNGTIKKSSYGNYIVQVRRPTGSLNEQCEVRVSTPNGMEMKALFRVKRIPDPIAQIGKSSGGPIGAEEFKAQGGVGAFLHNFDFDAKCVVQGFIVTHQSKRSDPVDVNNKGARYSQEAMNLIDLARPGDVYYFDNIRARCPGDVVGRKINSMVFKIK